MASEHVHEFFLGDNEGYCGCGQTITGAFEALEQQLAQARALLEEIAENFVPTQWNKSRLVYCDLCNEYGEAAEQIEHRPGCFVAKARAFLAREEGE